MKEVKSPKKPMAFYYIVVLALILLFNEMARPYMEQAQIVPVDYSTFMQSIDDKTVDHVEICLLYTSLLAAFFGVIVLLEERCELCMRCRALNASADDASPPKLCMGDWCRGEPVRAGNHDHARCEDGDDSFLQGFLDFHNAHPSAAEVLCHQTVLKMYPLDLAGSLLL